MPEGDTLLRTATRLRDLLVGRRVVDAFCGERRLPRDSSVDNDRSSSHDRPVVGPPGRRDFGIDAASLIGASIDRVDVRGKHLLIRFDDTRTLHSHLGMTGTWHVYTRGEAWRKPARQSSIAIETGDACVVCFSPKTLELLSETALRRHRWIARLGPDILADPFAEDEAVARFRPHGITAVGEAVLNQSIVCGIGNVYKSEILFRLGIDPFGPVRGLAESDLRAILRDARAIMRRNLDGKPRRTRFGHDGPRHAVYGRSGEPCLRCGARVRMRRQGDLGRSTYYCSVCQPPREHEPEPK